MSNFLLPWMKLTRLPAVLTVPGDVLVGAALANRDLSLRGILSVALAYLFGMVLNDLVDAPRDMKNRPERPIPSGAVSKTAAFVACFLLGSFAFLLQAAFPIVLLLGLIMGYDLLKNLHPVVGALLMCSCRCAVLWIGAGAPSSLDLLWPLWGTWSVIILGITLLADRENRETPHLLFFSGMLTLFWCLTPFIALMIGQPRYAVFLPWALLMYLALHNLRGIKEAGSLQPRNTGQWLSMLIPLQAVFLLVTAPLWQGAFILSLWPLLPLSIRKMQIS